MPGMMDTQRSKKSQLHELMEETKSIGKTKPAKPKAAQPEPLPERAPARGLEAHGIEPAAERAMGRMADGGTPRTGMDAPRPMSAQEMLERMQGAGPKRR